MTKSKSKVPCRCGHSKINHKYKVWENEGMSCLVWACGCEDYRQDNLKYLENKYNERNS